MERTKNAKEIAAEYRMSHWTGIMRERVESGLSIRAYCAREGMPTNRYHYWQRRLRAAAAKELMPTNIEPVAPVPVGWRQVTSAEETTSRPNSTKNTGVSVEIGKCRVNVDEAADMEMLRKVCNVLVSLC